MKRKSKSILKGIMTIVLSVAMVIGVVPLNGMVLPVRAEEEMEIVAETIPNYGAKIGETNYATLREAIAAAQNGDTVTLLQDYVAGANDESLSISNKTLTLDLNGHNIDYSENTSAYYIIHCTDVKLTLTDNSEGKTGKIIGNSTQYMFGVCFNSSIYDLEHPTNAFVMEAGTITDCNNHGVYCYYCPFTMTGGTVTNCNGYDDSAVHIGYSKNCTISGGKITNNKTRGVYMDGESDLTLSGTAEISGNTYNENGAGVYVGVGTLTMEGGTISGNIAYNGGGVYINDTTAEDKVAFTMTGGTISDNIAGYQGGGVYVQSGYKFRMTGGSIIGNSATYSYNYTCGGVYVSANTYYQGELLVSGDASITGNQYTVGDESRASNVFLDENYLNFIVEGALTGEIGIRPIVFDDVNHKYITSTDPFAVAAETYNGGILTDSDAECFISDDASYDVGLVEGKAKLIDRVAATGVTLNKDELSLTEGESETLTATIEPNGATDKRVIWSSSAEGVATVDNNGKVTAVSEGTVTITAKTRDGGFTATCAVTVKPIKDDDNDDEDDVPVVETVNMNRLYNPNSGEHFYTASVGERDWLVSLGWQYEGIGWKAPAKSNTPVYRLYNPNSGDHHFTISVGERDWLVSLGWNSEGIGWYSDDNKSVPLYRQYNPNSETGTHNYTANKNENDWLVSLGWNAEGIGWYGVK